MLIRAVACVRRISTSGVGVVVNSGVAKSAAAAVPVPTTEAAAAAGKKYTPAWARYNVDSTAAVDVAEVRRTAVISQVSEEAAGRRVTIYKQSQSAMTSGTAGSKNWSIRFNHTGDKWSNQLMSYLSSADTLQQHAILVEFESPEQAILYCERNGWAYDVSVPVEHGKIGVDARGPGNQYSYNILPLGVTSAMKAAGSPRRARKIFEYDASPVQTGVSTWSNLRHTQYGPDAWRPRVDPEAAGVKQTAEAWTGPEWPAERSKIAAAAHEGEGH